jgi:hypothetical protein
MPNAHIFLLVNILGGSAVLGSYAFGLILYPDNRMDLWGEIEGIWQTIFVTSMLLAAAGYLFFLGYIYMFKPMVFDQGLILGPDTLSILSTVFLASATAWMPATIAYINNDSGFWWC